MKIFKFRGKKYKWNMQVWQLFLIMLITIACMYGLMLSMFYIGDIING